MFVFASGPGLYESLMGVLGFASYVVVVAAAVKILVNRSNRPTKCPKCGADLRD
jgi:hypothetical protein